MIALKMLGFECMRVVVNGALSRYNNTINKSKRAIAIQQYQTPILTLVYWKKKTTSSPTPTIARLKRENITYINYHSSFSQWKILIGPSDWKDHSAGKEGAERYRIQNLPNCTSYSPGFYELGIATSAVDKRREPLRLIESSSVIPVYVGQADNVRSRVQNYGRDGAHLETINASDHNHSLFSDVFYRGFPIVYRWAPTRSKEEAERREEELLGTYDYAWNKRNNGARRHEEILTKLSFLSIIRPYLYERHELGDKMRSGDRNLELQSCKEAICGVGIGHGLVCRKPPVEGRKRCAEHKGVKVKANRQRRPPFT